MSEKLTGFPENSMLSTLKSLKKNHWLKNAVFEALYRLETSSKTTRKFRYFRWRLCLVSAVKVLQYLSLLWYWEMEVTGWDSVRSFWSFLSFARIDLLVHKLGVLSWSFELFSCLLWLNFLGFWVLVAEPFGGKGFSWFVSFFKTLFGFTFEVAYVPLVVNFLVTLKYSTWHSCTIKEYFSVPFEALSPSIAKGVASGVFVVLAAIFKYLWILTSCDKNHFTSETNLNSVSSANYFHKVHLCEVILVLLFLYDIQSFYPVILCMFTVVTLQLVYFVPFFESVSNKVFVASYSLFAYYCSVFLVSKTTDKAIPGVLLTLIVTPLVGFLAVKAVEKRLLAIQKVPLEKFTELNSVLNLELQLRPYMTEASLNSNSVIKALSNCYVASKFQNQKMLPIWTTHYCFYVTGNLKLAKLKLSHCLKCESNFSDDYQEFKCQKLFKGTIYQKSNEFKLIKSLLLSEEIMEKDKELCSKLLEYWREFFVPNPSLEKLEKLTNYLVKNLDVLIDLNAKVLETYPENKDAIRNHLSFVEEFILDQELQNNLVLKCNRSLNQTERFNGDKIIVNSLENGIILVSGNPKDLGQIVYANERAGEILNLPVLTLLGSDIDELVPPPYNNHLKTLRNYLVHTTNAELELPEKLFLMRTPQELVQVKIKVKVVTYGLCPYFLVCFKPCDTISELAIVSQEGFIYSHTQNFNRMLTNTQVINTNIQKYLPELTPDRLRTLKPFKSRDLFILPSLISVNTSSIFIVLLFKEEAQILKCSQEKGCFRQNLSYASFFDYEKCDLVIGQQEPFRNSKILKETNVDSSSASTKCFSQSRRGKEIIQRGQKAIRFYNWILLGSILVVLLTNSGIIFYIAKKIEASKSLGYLEEFSQLRLDINEIAKNSVKTYNSQLLGLNHTLHTESIVTHLQKLENTLEQIDFSAHWIECQNSAQFTKEIPVWENYQNPTLKYKNLLNVLDELSRHSKNVVSEAQAKNSLFYIVANSFKSIDKYLQDAVQEFVDCEKEKVENLDRVANFLVFLAVGVLLICFFVLGWSSKIINYQLHVMWNFVRFHVVESYAQLKQSVTNRLYSVHEDFYDDYQPCLRGFEEVNFRTSFKFIKRILAFVGISCLYYGLMFLAFYKRSENLLTEKPEYISGYQRLQGELSLLDFWTHERLAKTFQGLKISDLLSKTDLFLTPEIEYARVAELVALDLNELKQKELTLKFSETTKELLLDKKESEVPLLRYGYFNSLLGYLHETSYLDSKDFLELWSYFESVYQEIKHTGIEVAELVETDISEMIDYQMALLVTCAGIYSAVTLLLYVFSFRTFLLEEGNKLLNLQKVGMLIPASKKLTAPNSTAFKEFTTNN